MLLLDANRFVVTDRLIDAVWGDDPPATARSQVHICVSALRRMLTELSIGDLIVTRSAGYLIKVEPGQLDMHVFERMVTDAGVLARTGAIADAAAGLRQALALWSGPALTGINSMLVQTMATRLNETYLGVHEDCVAWELQLGRHHGLISELMMSVAEHPLRERLCGQLMTALYRSGRQAEALEVYRNARDVLAEQLGIDPGAELRALEASILAHDAELLVAETPAAVVNEPRQLSADTSDFTGRATQVSDIIELLTAPRETAVPVVVVTGQSGVGKSTLVTHVAHRIAISHYPDAQLHVDLRGSQADPIPTEELLSRFLRALGVPGPAIPESTTERAELYRSRLADRRVLIVLDDAADEAQVRLLIPGSASCAVIITSRVPLTGLPGSYQVNLAEFSQAESCELLGTIIGFERTRAEPTAAATLSDLVDGLPLALRVVGARVAARSHWKLETMVLRLVDERRRLDELTHGDLAVRASISLTYNSLPPQARRLLRALSDIPGDNFPSWVGAAVLDIDLVEAEELLDQLVDAHLLGSQTSGELGTDRYQIHALIRIFAWEKLQDDPPEVRRLGLAQVCAGWLALAEHAHGQLYGGQFTLLHGTAPCWRPPTGFREIPMPAPLDWLESERANLTAAVRYSANADMSELSWDLAMTLVTLFETRSYFDDWAETHKFALAATRQEGNQRGTAAMLASLGSLHVSRLNTSTATELLERALELFDELGDRHGRALTLRSLASLDYHMGAAERAMRRYESALADLRQVGDPIGVAHVLVNIGQLLLDAGESELATKHLDEALIIAREVGSQRTEAQVLCRLGNAQLERDQIDAAFESFTSALRLVRYGGDRTGERHARSGLSAVYAHRGDLGAAETSLHDALRICEELADTVGRARALLELGGVLTKAARNTSARECLTKALAIFRTQHLRLWEQRSLEALAALET